MRDAKEIRRVLGLEFPPEVIDEKNGLFYVPHEHVRQRLIDATDNEFDWSVKQILFREDDPAVRRANDRNTGEIVVPPVMIVLGTLTIPGLGSRDGLGAHPIDKGAGEDAAYKSAESDALKRAAMAFGVGLHQLYIEPGEAKRAQKPSRNRTPQQQASRATTSRATSQKPANERAEMTDAEFDQAVRDALTSRDGNAYRALVRDAGKYTSRWLILIRHADSETNLKWIEKEMPDGVKSTLIEAEIAKQRQEITT